MISSSSIPNPAVLSPNNPKMRFTAGFSIQAYYIKAYHSGIWLSLQLWQDNVGLRERTCISCQPPSVVSTPLRASSCKEAATKENPQDNTVYLRNYSTPQFPVGTRIFAAHVMHLQSRLRMQFNIISNPTQNDHIIVGSEPPRLLWSFHLIQTSGSTTRKSVWQEKHLVLSTVTGVFQFSSPVSSLERGGQAHFWCKRSGNTKSQGVGEKREVGPCLLLPLL